MSLIPNFSFVGIDAITTELLAVSVTFLAITWISVLMRLWVRAVSIRSLGWDDYTVVASLVRRYTAD